MAASKYIGSAEKELVFSHVGPCFGHSAEAKARNAAWMILEWTCGDRGDSSSLADGPM